MHVRAEISFLGKAEGAVRTGERFLSSMHSDVTRHMGFLPSGVGTVGTMVHLDVGGMAVPHSRYSSTARDHLWGTMPILVQLDL